MSFQPEVTVTLKPSTSEDIVYVYQIGSQRDAYEFFRALCLFADFLRWKEKT